MAGLTDTGITIKDVDEILADIVADQIANIDAELNTESDGVLGQLNGIYAAALAELWELLEEIYQSAYADTASGQSLSYVSALTGTIRQVATKAELDVHLEGTVSTSVPAGTRCYPDGDADSVFETTAVAVIEEHGATDYVAVTMQAVTEGSATTAAAGDTLIISTPVSGLAAITTDGSSPLAVGLDEETDAELRLRREQGLALAGASTVDAIRADMLTVTGVDSCTVFENPSAVADSDGLDPYAIEVLIYSAAAPAPAAQDLADQIWASKPAGTQVEGGYGEYATDAAGNTHLMRWSIPTTVQAFVTVTLTAGTDYVGDSGTADAIEAWALANLTVGRDVYASDIINVVADLEGVISVDVSAVGVASGTPIAPLPADMVVQSRQLATIDAADVQVNP